MCKFVIYGKKTTATATTTEPITKTTTAATTTVPTAKTTAAAATTTTAKSKNLQRTFS